MLRVVFFYTLLLVAPALAALQDAGPVGSKSYSEQLDAANRMFLAELRKRMQQKGYKEVEVIPQMFIVRAKENGHSVTLIVDSDSLESLSVGPQTCPSATDDAQ